MTAAPTYIPGIHCVMCLNVTGERVAASRTVGRYRACDEHAPLLERSPSLSEALRSAKHHNAIRGA